MSYKIIPTPTFEKELKHLSKKYPSLKKDIIKLSDSLLKTPQMGIALGNGCFKIRMVISSKGKGKSGGARIITHVQVMNEHIFLVAIYDKSEIANISEREINERLKRLQ
ncbi:MAG: type II toxin-antitoxin system RelE/ParE family toxin [Bacteroidetes bacterium]|nr:type II toxin-antitoxin system RelE/ParE family toxin [Bacteroidota bacterium]